MTTVMPKAERSYSDHCRWSQVQLDIPPSCSQPHLAQAIFSRIVGRKPQQCQVCISLDKCNLENKTRQRHYEKEKL